MSIAAGCLGSNPGQRMLVFGGGICLDLSPKLVGRGSIYQYDSENVCEIITCCISPNHAHRGNAVSLPFMVRHLLRISRDPLSLMRYSPWHGVADGNRRAETIRDL